MRRDLRAIRDFQKARLYAAGEIAASNLIDPVSHELLDGRIWHELLTCMVECWAEDTQTLVPEAVWRLLRCPRSREIPNALHEQSRLAIRKSVGTFRDLSAFGTWYEEYAAARLTKQEDGTYALVRDRSSRKSRGLYFTPPEVVAYLTERTLGRLIDAGDCLDLRILDPACGAGAFLAAAGRLLILRRRRKASRSPIPPAHLFGIDLDPRAAQLADVTLLLASALHGSHERPDSHTIRCGNALIGTDIGSDEDTIVSLHPLDWREAFHGVSSDGGFDVVLGNPPWVSYGIRGTGTMPPLVASYLRSRYPRSAEYKLPIYPLFIEKAISMLRDGGYCGFVLPDSFLLGRYFSKIRRYILDTTAIQEIVFFEKNFWPAGHSGRTVVLLMRKETDPSIRKENECVIARCRNPADLSRGLATSLCCPQEFFERSPKNRFRLFFDAESRDFVERCERVGNVPLASIASVHTGVRSRIGQRLIVGRERQGPLWKPGIVSGRQVDRYRLVYEGHFIRIDPAVLWGGGYDPSVVGQEKLIMRQTGDRLAAAYDGYGYYHLNNCHSIVIEDRRYDLKYLLALMNSRLMNRYYQLISLEKDRALAQTDIDMIEDLPLPPLPLDAQQPFVECVDRILAVVNDGTNRSNLQFDELLREIDEKVERLYGCRDCVASTGVDPTAPGQRDPDRVGGGRSAP